jgi:hypothetical protein
MLGARGTRSGGGEWHAGRKHKRRQRWPSWLRVYCATAPLLGLWLVLLPWLIDRSIAPASSPAAWLDAFATTGGGGDDYRAASVSPSAEHTAADASLVGDGHGGHDVCVYMKSLTGSSTSETATDAWFWTLADELFAGARPAFRLFAVKTLNGWDEAAAARLLRHRTVYNPPDVSDLMRLCDIVIHVDLPPLPHALARVRHTTRVLLPLHPSLQNFANSTRVAATRFDAVIPFTPGVVKANAGEKVIPHAVDLTLVDAAAAARGVDLARGGTAHVCVYVRHVTWHRSSGGVKTSSKDDVIASVEMLTYFAAVVAALDTHVMGSGTRCDCLLLLVFCSFLVTFTRRACLCVVLCCTHQRESHNTPHNEHLHTTVIASAEVWSAAQVAGVNLKRMRRITFENAQFDGSAAVDAVAVAAEVATCRALLVHSGR